MYVCPINMIPYSLPRSVWKISDTGNDVLKLISLVTKWYTEYVLQTFCTYI